jgi:energy-coupling factor transporter ATP-binding protein EcfA2
MKLIAGIAKPSSGTVQVKGITVNGLPPERLSGTVAYVFQNPEDMFIGRPRMRMTEWKRC